MLKDGKMIKNSSREGRATFRCLMNELATDPVTSSQTNIIEGATLDQFLVSPNEQECLSQFERTTFKYIQQQKPTQTHLPYTWTSQVQRHLYRPVSTYKYIEVLDMNVHSKEAVLTSQATLQSKAISGFFPFERALYSTSQSSHISDSSLRCNAPEAGTRIWLHAMLCVNTTGLNIVVVSADTDTIFIGLTHTLPSDKIYIKTN